MSQPFVGEIRMFAGTFPPLGWADCDGAPLPISENDTLFNLIGTTYGGDGQQIFNLPDLQSRLPIHQGTLAGTTFIIGEAAGVEQVTLTTAQIPSHTHVPQATTSNGSSSTPSGKIFAESLLDAYSAPGGTPAQMNPAAIGAAGGSQPHSNIMPICCIRFIISLFGYYPNPN